MAGNGTTGIKTAGIGFIRPFFRLCRWSLAGLIDCKSDSADVEKYTHFGAQLPFVTAEGIVWLIHLRDGLANLPKKGLRRAGGGMDDEEA
jgi:hypothetical protein